MSGTRLLARIAAAALGTIAFAAGCNAIVGNGDIDFATDGGAPDATTAPEASAESGPTQETQDAGYDAPEAIDDASPEASPPDAACEAGTKLCAGACRGFDDPGYGCGPTHCSPCEVANAFAGCAAIDAGVDGGAHVGTDGGADSGTNGDVLACSVAACMGIHADCNGTPLDGCETDTSSDLYNCGTCGNDCTKLPNVAGNVTCTGGHLHVRQQRLRAGLRDLHDEPGKRVRHEHQRARSLRGVRDDVHHRVPIARRPGPTPSRAPRFAGRA